MRVIAVVLSLSAFLGCSDKAPGPAPIPSSTSSSVAALPDAPASPFSVVLESKGPITFSGLVGGVVVADEARTVLATATFAGELSANQMPEGLPTEGGILRFSGRVPGSIWVLFEEPGKPAPKNPFLRLERNKGAFKQYAADWKPHLAAWSQNRMLSMSTSSGKLKIKVVEPYQDKPLPDWPSSTLSDEGCTKSLKVETIAALPTGEVFASGTCKVGKSGRRHVVISWPAEIATDKLDAGIIDSGSDAAGDAADAGDALDAGDGGNAPAEPVGIPGEVFVIAGAPAGMKHLDLIAHGPGDVWLLGSDGSSSSLYRLDAGAFKAQALPKLQGSARAIAATIDGTLWLLSESAIWKRFPPGEWEEIPPPTRAFPEPDPRWEMLGIGAGESEVWIAAKHTSSKAGRHVVLRQRAPKHILRWQ